MLLLPVRREVLDNKLVEETVVSRSIEGFGHIQENLAGQPPLVKVSTDFQEGVPSAASC
jgi:hypothetical protein